MATATKRGKGSCPSCNTEYFCRYKPANCPNCSYILGGSYVPTAKKPKLLVPQASIVVETKDVGIYSVKTSTHDDRCIVVRQGRAKICHHSLCLEKRAIYVNSQNAESFGCQHLDTLKREVHNTSTYNEITSEQLELYPCSTTLKEHIKKLNSSSGSFPIAVKVSPTMFCVFGDADASNPMGYCHVRVSEKDIKCCSKNCRSFVSKGKQQKARKICIHMHILFCLQLCSIDTSSKAKDSQIINTQENSFNVEPVNSARQRTIDVRMGILHFPYIIPPSIIKSSSSCPDQLESTDTECKACGTPLGQNTKHPGSRGVSYVINDQYPFKHINVLVKICSNCGVMHQSFPYEQGLFNISDKVIVTFDILLQWRYLFKRGVSISIAIESKLESLVEKAQEPPSENELMNISRLLYNGFYAFEMSTERDMNSVVCGICGTASEIYFGDGNEKNCCELSEIDYKSDDPEGQYEPMQLECFLTLLKRRLVECTTYTRCEDPFKIPLSKIPPIIAPALRGDVVLNTEHLKRSAARKQLNTSTPEGDPALLHQLITSKKLDMESIEELDHESLKQTCQDCKIVTTTKSQAAMRLAIQSLYESLLVGNCPCHGFTKVPNHTGGFYHFVCRHGVTAASKFLTLQESVRDPADLFLSLRVPPLTLVCDTPCGLVRHMDCRVPETTELLWGEFRGCFEKPSLNKAPCNDIDIPTMTLAEFRNIESTASSPLTHKLAHPLTGSTRRYILGDRFHTSSNPHKSPLCQYHEIN